ncbi:MAG: sigma 54-interacting transcriptional regulator [Byssovorax sp.]
MAGDDFRTKTIEESALLSDALDEASPGLVVIFSDGRPKCLAIRLDKKAIEIGRVASEGVFVVEDDRVSRRHARIAIKGDTVRVTDLDSRNGVFVDGKRVLDETFARLPRLLRVGQTLFRFTPDIRPFLRGTVEVTAEGIVGPTLRASRDWINRASAAGDTLLLTGPSGSGKELAARAYHATGRFATGPFIAVNCAAIPQGLAERLLFGAKKGAYSGATSDSEGYVQAADHGTLFLDEVAELDLGVQPKLLRVLEMREALALGAAHPKKVDLQVCAATLKDLRGEVSAGRFREDLYYRIGRPEVRLPSLIDRLEEVPALAAAELLRADAKLVPSSGFLEACALRAWPGNVREFLREVRQAARAALDGGRSVVESKDLSPTAGEEISAEVKSSGQLELSREAIEAGLKKEQGNVTRAARVLGMHRNQLRRWLSRNNVDPKLFGSGAEPEEEVQSDGRTTKG